MALQRRLKQQAIAREQEAKVRAQGEGRLEAVAQAEFERQMNPPQEVFSAACGQSAESIQAEVAVTSARLLEAQAVVAQLEAQLQEQLQQLEELSQQTK